MSPTQHIAWAERTLALCTLCHHEHRAQYDTETRIVSLLPFLGVEGSPLPFVFIFASCSFPNPISSFTPPTNSLPPTTGERNYSLPVES